MPTMGPMGPLPLRSFELCDTPGMGYPGHFVGMVQGGQVADLFGESSTEGQEQYNEGAIVEVCGSEAELLADPESAQAELYMVAAKRLLDPVFPREVEEQVQSLLADPGIDDETLFDRTGDPFVTIDGADSMDLDQALYVEAQGQGHIVHYALADASYYVQPGTPLHAEALKRGASYYLPGFMVPMLPRLLSEGLVSLNADVLRRSVVFSMTLDAEGRCTNTEVQPSRIRSRGKLSFDAVERFYEGGDGFETAVNSSLHCLAEVGQRRMMLAEERGVVRYRRREVSAKLSSGGIRFTATSTARRQVERYNEQLSLLCNIERARILARHGADFVEPIYRVHPAPSEEKMQAFEEMLAALVKAQGLEKGRWLWSSQSERPLWKYLDQLPQEGAEGRIASAIHRQAVMANLRSTFQTEAAAHHGVGAEVYARFSAPMREMIGVFLHRELLEAQKGHGHQDPELRQQVLSRANAAKTTQRDVSNEGNRLVLDQIFEDAHKGQNVLPGTLMGMQGSKAYVRLDQPPIDIKVYLKLASKRIRPSTDGASLLQEGQVIHRLGDEVSVRVMEKDPKRDRWKLELVAS